MTLGISNKFLRQTFQRNIFRFLPVQEHVNKSSSSAYHTVCFHRQKEKSRDHTFINNHAWKTMSHTSMPLCMNFQIRNISNETNALKNNEQSLDVQSAASPEETIDYMTTHLPSGFQTMSDWKIVEFAQQMLLKVHETTGLPWWASITLTALIARTIVTLPFSIITVQNTAKLEKVRNEMDEVVERLKNEANYACKYHHWPEELARKEYVKAVKREYTALRIRDNCHPAKNFILIWIQLPLWFSFSIATRNLCYMLPQPDYAAQATFMEMSVGGFGWVHNLVTPDSTLILPILLGLTNLAIIEAHQLFRTVPPRKLDWYLTNFFRLLSLFVVVLSSYLPAATIIYWITSSTFGLLQIFLLHSLKLRRIFRIPIVKSELEHPYRYFYSKLKSKL